MAKIQSDKGRSTKEEGKELKASKRKTGATDVGNKDA